MLNKKYFKKHITLLKKSIKGWERRSLNTNKDLRSFAKSMLKIQKARLKEFEKCLKSLNK